MQLLATILYYSRDVSNIKSIDFFYKQLHAVKCMIFYVTQFSYALSHFVNLCPANKKKKKIIYTTENDDKMQPSFQTLLNVAHNNGCIVLFLVFLFIIFRAPMYKMKTSQIVNNKLGSNQFNI